MNALSAAIRTLCDTGDYVICEEFTYTHAPGGRPCGPRDTHAGHAFLHCLLFAMLLGAAVVIKINPTAALMIISMLCF